MPACSSNNKTHEQCTPDELQLLENGTITSCRQPLDMPMARRNWIDTEVSVEGSVPPVRRGVKFGEGDGTVPLLSLGTMCAKGWKDERWNPAKTRVITQEFSHDPEGLDLRGGATTGKRFFFLVLSRDPCSTLLKRRPRVYHIDTSLPSS